MRVVRIDGAEYRGPAAPGRAALDGLAGPGLIETMRARNGRIADRDAHLARLSASRTALRGPDGPGPERIASELDAVLAVCRVTDALVRVVLGRRALVVEAAPIGPLPTEPAALAAITVSGLWRPEAAEAEHKRTERGHWLRAEAAATAAGAELALATDTAGRLGEGSRASVFVVAGGVLQTAPVTGLLPGIGRAAVIALHGDVREAAPAVERWRAATEIFVVSALRGVSAVVAIDGTVVSGGTPGPVTRRLAAAYRERVLVGGGSP
jgi:branched-subunit amino acid aminotransferase/4-amino-4-deoxychorismate lyase